MILVFNKDTYRRKKILRASETSHRKAMESSTVPLQLEPFQQSSTCEKRLWIGNLDLRVNEYQLLKLVRVHGPIEKFDMLVHRSGPNAGHSRGFAFVTYKLKEDATRAMNSLNGQLLGNRKIAVKFAKNNSEGQEKSKPELLIPALAGGSLESTGKLSKKMAIQCIEAKLKAMESVKPEDDFMPKRSTNEPPIIAQYQTNLHQNTHKHPSSFQRRHPYHRRR